MKPKINEKILPVITITTTIVVIIFIIYRYLNDYPNATTAVPINDNLKTALSYLLELNKFLISISTLLFAIIGYYISKFSKDIFNKWVEISYLFAIIFLGSSYYFSIKVYSSIVEELSFGFIGLKYGYSIILFNQDMSYWTIIGSSIILFTIFFYILINKNK